MSSNILVPELAESVVEATVSQWLKQEGEQVTAGEPLVELETDKINLEVSAPKSGILARIDRPAGDDVKVGDVLGVIEEQGSAGAESGPSAPVERREQPSQAAPSEREPAPMNGPKGDKATPVAKSMAEAHGIDLAQVVGSGPQQRVTRQDVQALIERQPPPPAPPAPVAAPAKPAAAQPPSSAATNRREERVRMSRRRQTIAQRLVEAQHTAAMLTTFNEVDMTAVMEVRKRRKEAFKERFGVSLGLTSFFVKAVIGALKAFPLLNAEIQGDEMVIKHYYDIGVATGAAEGLVVPVLRDADRLSFGAIEQAVKAYAQKAEQGTITLDDLRGGSFTITNGGVFGSLLSTPILNTPQVGILGLHKIEERPIARNGEVIICPMMYLALSYDHRIVDGREAVQFLVRVKELIESPEALLLES